MLTEVFPIQVKGSEPGAKLCTYIIEHSESIGVEKRPLMLMCPGGGYEYTSDREAECIFYFSIIICHRKHYEQISNFQIKGKTFVIFVEIIVRISQYRLLGCYKTIKVDSTFHISAR